VHADFVILPVIFVVFRIVSLIVIVYIMIVKRRIIMYTYLKKFVQYIQQGYYWDIPVIYDTNYKN
jgi:coproporphyrinogen III oxidase